MGESKQSLEAEQNYCMTFQVEMAFCLRSGSLLLGKNYVEILTLALDWSTLVQMLCLFKSQCLSLQKWGWCQGHGEMIRTKCCSISCWTHDGVMSCLPWPRSLDMSLTRSVSQNLFPLLCVLHVLMDQFLLRPGMPQTQWRQVVQGFHLFGSSQVSCGR